MTYLKPLISIRKSISLKYSVPWPFIGYSTDFDFFSNFQNPYSFLFSCKHPNHSDSIRQLSHWLSYHIFFYSHKDLKVLKKWFQHIIKHFKSSVLLILIMILYVMQVLALLGNCSGYVLINKPWSFWVN